MKRGSDWAVWPCFFSLHSEPVEIYLLHLLPYSHCGTYLSAHFSLLPAVHLTVMNAVSTGPLQQLQHTIQLIPKSWSSISICFDKFIHHENFIPATEFLSLLFNILFSWQQIYSSKTYCINTSFVSFHAKVHLLQFSVVRPNHIILLWVHDHWSLSCINYNCAPDSDTNYSISLQPSTAEIPDCGLSCFSWTDHPYTSVKTTRVIRILYAYLPLTLLETAAN